VRQVVAPDRCVERSGRADRARIVDQDVDAAEFVRRLADGIGHPLLVPDVDHQRKRPAAGLVDLLGCRIDRALKLRMRLRRLCGDGDIRATLSLIYAEFGAAVITSVISPTVAAAFYNPAVTLRSQHSGVSAVGFPISVSAAQRPVRLRTETSRSGRGRIGLHGAGESVAKRIFLGVGEGRLQHDTAIVLDLLDHLVSRHFLDKHKQCGVAWVDAFCELLHKWV
jgi:hypothetical protein